MSSERALVLVDIQNDFCEGGSLAVTGGAEVARRAAERVRTDADRPPGERRYSAVVATADWHDDPGDHWARPGDAPDFASSWPVHCAAGTPGADFHPALGPALGAVGEIFRKGWDEAAYSGFEGTAAGDGSTGLAAWLRERGVSHLDVAGIATDHCVRATVLDALREGFEVDVLTDSVAGVAPGTTQSALEEMRAAGATLV